MAFFLGLGTFLVGVALIVFSKRLADFNERINKAVFGIRLPSWPSRIVTIFVGLWWSVFGLWLLFTFFASYF